MIGMRLRIFRAVSTISRTALLDAGILFAFVGGIASPTGAQINRSLSGTTVEVHLQEPNGTAMQAPAEIEIRKAGGEAGYTSEARGDGLASIRGVPAGDYTVEVRAQGYETARERLLVAPNAISASVYVTMKPSAETAAAAVDARPAQLPVLTGKSRKELDQAIADLRDGKIESAGKHLEYPLKFAPGDPSVQYFAGLYSVDLKDYAAARQHFESAVNIFPDLVNAQIELASLLLQQLNDPAEALPHLTHAIALDASSWRAHWLVAQAYLAPGGTEAKADAAKAQFHAQRAIELGKEKSAGAAVTLAFATALEGNRDEARAILEKFIHEYPNDPLISSARQLLRSSLIVSGRP